MLHCSPGFLKCSPPGSYTACEIGEQTQALWDPLSGHRLITSLGRLATKDPLGGLL